MSGLGLGTGVQGRGRQEGAGTPAAETKAELFLPHAPPSTRAYGSPQLLAFSRVSVLLLSSFSKPVSDPFLFPSPPLRTLAQPPVIVIVALTHLPVPVP